MENGLRGAALARALLRELLAPVLACWMTLVCASSWGQTPPLPPLRIVGSLSGLNQYTHLEEPFWSQTLAARSGGKYKAEIVPFDRAGVPGEDMLRLIQFGVLPFGTALLSNISAQDPELAAPDLAGLNPDLASLRKNLAVFRPYLEKTLREEHGIQLLAIYSYPAQVLFCKSNFKGLSDLAGRRVRVSSATQADFVSAFGATPVRAGLSQILPDLESGSTDCAISGAMSGNTIGMHHLTHYLFAMPVTWGVSIFAANQEAWDNLPADLRALLSQEIPRLEAAIWADSEHETVEGLACNIGRKDCVTGQRGSMRLVLPSPRDEENRRAVFIRAVLQNWLQRSGSRSAALWNQTIGVTSGIPAASTP